jgi:hypothetical protein
MFKRSREEIKLESLLAQLDFFRALRDRHQVWAKDVNTSEIIELHLEIMDSIVKLRDRYNKLYQHELE